MMNENEKIMRRILGERGDKEALDNICEAHYGGWIKPSELDKEEIEELYECNAFVHGLDEFVDVYSDGNDDAEISSTIELFIDLLKSGEMKHTKNGYVWKNVV